MAEVQRLFPGSASEIRTVWITPYIAVQDSVGRLLSRGLWPPSRAELCTGVRFSPIGRCYDCGFFHGGLDA